MQLVMLYPLSSALCALAFVVSMVVALAYRARFLRMAEHYLYLKQESPGEQVIIITDAGEDLDDEMTVRASRTAPHPAWPFWLTTIIHLPLPSA